MTSAAGNAALPLEASEGVEPVRDELPALGIELTVEATTVSSHWLLEGENRLDAGYYATDAVAALRAVEDSGYPVTALTDDVEEVFILGRFRRIYATDPDAGWPYLSASEALTFRPTSDRWIAKEHAPREAEHHFAKEGWILVSCSGTVGRSVMVTKRLEPFFLTHDLARIVPSADIQAGYLYAFLNTWIGQALLSKDQYGSAIKHLEAHHIAAVRVPLLSENERQAMHEEVMRAYRLRDEANSLLDEADEMLHRELGLPRFDESDVPYLPPPPETPAAVEMPHPRAFTLRASELEGRFDASYHWPVARMVADLLRDGKYQPITLAGIAESIVIPPRFKRIYVSKQHGVPFLRPSQLPQMRPYDLGYISKLTKVLDDLELHRGDVLVTTDGTVGRVGLVTSHTAGWAGSNNIGRITYGVEANRNGYLAAFLSSPYGYYQLTRLIYGGVIDHIEVPHIEGVLVPDAPPDLQSGIGERVVAAFEKKDEATQVEEDAIRRLEDALRLNAP